MPPTVNCQPSTVNSPAALPYNSELSVWLSVDPLSDKYLGVSPYTYCGNNPVRLVDVDGREIWIVGDDGEGYQYKNGALYDKHGIEVSSSKEYVSQVFSALKVISKSSNKIIRNRLYRLETSNHKHFIKDSKVLTPNRNACSPDDKELASDPNIGCGSTTYFNVKNKYTYPDGADSYAPASLAHELLGHAYDNDCGNRTNAVSECNSIPLIEISSINIQNIILKEHGFKERTQYGFENGNRWVVIPQNLLNNYFTPNRTKNQH